MPQKGDSTKEQLDASRAARVLERKASSHQNYQALLRLARRTRLDFTDDIEKVDAALLQAEAEFETISAAVGGRISPRARAKQTSQETCTVFIDECGTHALTSKDSFRAFSLAAVVVRDSELEDFDDRWKAWKKIYLGSSEKLVHEPDLRKRKGAFYCDGNAQRQANAVANLSTVIGDLPFSGICCVLLRDKYVAEFGDERLDESLPQHAYLMTLHFLAERIALALQHEFGGAKGRLVFEARGPKEDASLQYEFARLFLDGTSYLSDAYFRHQFFPGLQFLNKEDNVSGLQIADLLARPCAEKALEPSSDPARWSAFQRKLCAGRFTANSILGLKVLPWHAEHDGMLPAEP